MKIYLNLNKKFPNSAVVIVDKTILLSHTLNFLYKFNFKNIVLLKNKNLKIISNFLNNYPFKFKIKNYKNHKFSYNLLTQKIFSNLFNENFLLIRTSKFTNLNLFNLYKKFLKNNEKLIITLLKKNKKLFNSEIFFVKKKLFNSFDFSFNKIINNPNYKLNFTDSEYFDCNKKKHDKKTIINFFSKIYSKAVILDRDGVINVNKGYVGFKKDFIFQKGAIKALKYLNDNKYNIYVVTNQSGIARGYFSEQDVIKLHDYINDHLESRGIYINKFYYSPYHKDGVVPKYKKNSSCRKPGIKLFNILCNEWNINNKKKFIMIGDQISDIEFAKKAEIKSALFKGGNLFHFIKDLKHKNKF